MQPLALAQAWAAGAPELREVIAVPDVNHYTLALGEPAPARWRMPWRPRSAGNRSRASLPALIKSRTGVVRHCEAALAPRSRSSSVLTPIALSAALASSRLRTPSTAPASRPTASIVASTSR